MGLLDEQNQPTPKIEDIQTFLEHHGVDVLALIEPELHGPHSRTFRRNPVSEQNLKQALFIPGYDILLPDTWYRKEQTLQNKALRCISGGTVSDTSTRELLQITGYLSVHQLASYLTLTSFHNAILNGAPQWIISQVVHLQDTRTRKSQLRVPTARLNLREESYLPRAIRLYNKLPPNLKTLTKIDFRRAARAWVWDNIPIRP